MLIFAQIYGVLKINIFSILVVCCASGFAQTQQDQRVWFAYTGQYKVANHWGYHIEAQFRMDNQLEQNLQNLFRIGGVYYISDTQNITAGYALVNTFNTVASDFFRESRIWEQYQISRKWHQQKNTLIQRFRLEQRWVEKLAVVNDEAVSLGSDYQNRIRYLNRNVFHLAHLNSNHEELYAVVQNEVFLNIGDNKVNGKIFDQNRFLIGLGLNYNNNIRIEIGYLNHYITSSASNDLMNHTLSVSLLQNLVLQKQ